MLNQRRRRRHRTTILTDIEKEMDTLREKQRRDDCGEDLVPWRCRTGFKNQFSIKETWYLLREEKPQCVWTKGVWFKKATPKYSFVTWIAMLDRLSTIDRVSKWSAGVDVTCVLCNAAPESRNYLFFECFFSSQIWKDITHGILQGSFTTD